MDVTSRGIQSGDIVTLGDTFHEVEIGKGRYNAISMTALTSGSKQEYVVLIESAIDNEDSVTVHDNARLLGISPKVGAGSHRNLVYVVPRSLYGGDSQ